MKLFYFLCLFVCLESVGQITTSVLIKGPVNVPQVNEVEGIAIYNRSKDQGTNTDSKGGFIIKASIDDQIEVVAMQYQHYNIRIDQKVKERT